MNHLLVGKHIFWAVLVAVFALAQTAAAGKTREQAMPNVLLIFADDLLSQLTLVPRATPVGMIP